jgi:hypothetical protein
VLPLFANICFEQGDSQLILSSICARLEGLTMTGVTSPHPNSTEFRKLERNPCCRVYTLLITMARPIIALPYVVAMIAVIIAVDTLIFRNHFWERLMVNIGIVLVFTAFYLRLLNHP